jgi:hypothetical protein
MWMFLSIWKTNIIELVCFFQKCQKNRYNQSYEGKYNLGTFTDILGMQNKLKNTADNLR